MKKVIVVIAAVVLLCALLIVGLPLFSRLYYHRSWEATLFAWQLNKEAYSTEEAFDAYLDEKRRENSAPYFFPEELDVPVSVAQALPGGMQFVILNGNASPDRLIVYFPGGSYIDQPRRVHWDFLGALASDTGSAVVFPIYPKLPGDNAESCISALSTAYEDFLRGTNRGELIFMGDSAGGGLALSFAMHLRDNGSEHTPEKIILISPWLDVTLSNPEIPGCEKKDRTLDAEQLRHLGALWADDLSLTDPLVSPLYGNFEALGTVTLVTGTADLLYPDILALHDKLSREGVEHEFAAWEGLFHVFPLYIGYSIPETKEAYDHIVAAILR